MKRLIVLTAAFISFSVAAASDSFPARVKAAELVEASAAGQAFQKTLWDRIGPYSANAMKLCVNAMKVPDTHPFTVVGDLTPEGRFTQAEVDPSTNVGLCFAKQLRAAPFPELPASRKGKSMPLVFKMKITQ